MQDRNKSVRHLIHPIRFCRSQYDDIHACYHDSVADHSDRAWLWISSLILRFRGRFMAGSAH